MTTLSFTGTVVACETRYTSKVKTAKLVDFDARFVVTIDVEGGERESFLIHSPAQLFRSGDGEFTGWRCAFTIDREVENDRTRWSNMTAKRL